MKVLERKTVYVMFSSGSMVYVGVPIYEGKSFEECLKMRSDDIIGYLNDEGKFVNI